MAETISELFFSHTGNVIDKWEQYLSIYEAEVGVFCKLGIPINLLEIGVQNGGSLELWRKYLPEGSKIQGIDIDQKINKIPFTEEDISISVVDATQHEQMKGILKDQLFEIIIDDGSHRSNDMIATFDICFSALAPGGIYIIEDFHAAYYPDLGGGLNNPDSASRWIKSFVDILHYDYISEDIQNAELDLQRLMQLNRKIARVTIYDSVVVIEKLKQPKIDPYRRILSGKTSYVMPLDKWFAEIPRENLRTLRLGNAIGNDLDARILKALETQDQKIKDLDVAKWSLQQQKDKIVNENNRLVEEVDRLKQVSATATIHFEEIASMRSEVEKQIELNSKKSAEIDFNARQLKIQVEINNKQSTEITQLNENLLELNIQNRSLGERLEDAQIKQEEIRSELHRAREEAQKEISILVQKLNRAYAAWTIKREELYNLKNPKRQ